VKGRQVTRNDVKGKRSRLTPCPAALERIIALVNQAAPQIDLLDLALNVPNLDEEFLQFLKRFPRSEDDEPELDFELEIDQRSVDEWDEWISRLLCYHHVMTTALESFAKDVRVRLWEEALMPDRLSDKYYGPSGELSDDVLAKQTHLARELAPRLANDASDQSLSFLSEFLTQSQENARLYFWAFYGLSKKYISLRENRMNLDKVMNIAALNPSDRLTYSPALYRIVISQEYSVDEQGRFIQASNQFTDALQDDNVDVTRIRHCDNCKKIFWAGRKDQMCCTPACNHARHSRLTRERYAQGYYQGAKRETGKRPRNKTNT
jgi:hypothetical protein